MLGKKECKASFHTQLAVRMLVHLSDPFHCSLLESRDMWRAGLTKNQETHRKDQVFKDISNRQTDSGCSTFVLSSLQDFLFKLFLFRFGFNV